MIANATAVSAALTPIEKSVKNDRVEDKLNRDEHSHKVAVGYKTEDTDEEQQRADSEECINRNHFLSSFLAIITPPMIQANRNTEMNSNGST